MKVVIQRVLNASVKVNNELVSFINKGFLVFLGVGKGDTEQDMDYLLKKITNLRIFEDEYGKFNYSIRDVKGEILVVSQFTLFANCSKGNRPSFEDAEEPEKAKHLYEAFIDKLKQTGIIVKSGIFGAKMEVELVNDGPVTIIVDSKKR